MYTITILLAIIWKLCKDREKEENKNMKRRKFLGCYFLLSMFVLTYSQFSRRFKVGMTKKKKKPPTESTVFRLPCAHW